MSEYDLVIRGGMIVDGSGGEPYEGDLAIHEDKIAVVGIVPGTGKEEIDASGKIVTPGFVDIHTHYDGQITWGERLTPSSMHGVTCVVMGNCGVGFSPCNPQDRGALIKLMEGIEDIPEAVMADGLPWQWSTFPEYMDFLETRVSDIDFATQVPHAPLRVYVMGERGINREPATEADLAQMSALVTEGIGAGALGVSTSRNLNHRTKAGELAPQVTAELSELEALARGLRLSGTGVFQMIPMFERGVEGEIEIIRKILAEAQRPLSFTLLRKQDYEDKFDLILDYVEQANAEGASIKAQIFPRPVGYLLGLDLSSHPFMFHPSYKAISHLPLEQRVAIMRDPEFRTRILAEAPEEDNPAFLQRLMRRLDSSYALGSPPNYGPTGDDTMAEQAKKRGITPLEVSYDVLLENGGTGLLLDAVANYIGHSLDPLESLLDHPDTLVSLGDGGAHYGMICDASYTTSLLTYWTRDRANGTRRDLGRAVRTLSRDTALAVGLGDRGLLAPGFKADINVINYDNLALHSPHMVWDLPGGGKRLVQDATGYDITIVGGEITYRDGIHTGALPGRLIRGARQVTTNEVNS